MTTSTKTRPLVLAVVTGDAAFLGAALAAITDLLGEGNAPRIEADLAPDPHAPEPHPLYVEALGKARRYLARTGQPPSITVVQADTMDHTVERLATLADAGPLGVVFLDVDDTRAIDERLDAFHARLAAANVPALRSPYTAIAHTRVPPWSDGAHALPDRCIVRARVPAEPWLLRAEILVALADFLELTFDKPRLHKAALRDAPSTLGDELARFLGDRAGAEWLFFYYTGSSVTGLIDHLERVTRERGVLALRGANEHALACGALANHLLHGRPSLTVIGSAMMDEFRGALANLRWAGAKGLIVCPEADPGVWFCFQGTINGEEDMRKALAARGIASVYIERPEVMPERLEEAFRLYEEGRGPVALLVTHAVIDERSPLPRALVYPDRQGGSTVTHASPETEEALAKALAILNGERTKILWQCGRLDLEEEDLVYEIAERAGVALVDSFHHPGTVSARRRGRNVPNYLGTLGLYGFAQRAHAFLHTDGKLSPRADQCVFFLKSKVSQRATIFTPSRRAGLRMVQVTNRADHRAPDVELALVMDAKDFLRRVQGGLRVDPEVYRHRMAAIEAAAPPALDVASRLPSLPMSPNYFFRELGALVERMIAEDRYEYTGVYDVGRCSVTALRSVPRTGPGFSGWYGRALMGDAPAALSTMIVTEPGNVVAFVGDGARSIVADPLPSLIDNALAHPGRAARNLTIFYLSNGTFSGIRTYRERLASRWGGRQMRTLDLLEPDAEQAFGPLTLVRRRVTAFDPALLRALLLAPGRINLVTVLLGHSVEDDGFSLVSASGWQREDADPAAPLRYK